MKLFTLLLLFACALLVHPTSVHALSGGTAITCVNGTCSVTTVTFDHGGTGQTTAPDDNVLVGSGSGWVLKALTTCVGTGKAVTYDASTNAFGCNTISAGVTPPIMFSFGEITTSQTIYGGPNGVWDATEAAVTVPMPAGTFGNLRCLNSKIQGVSNNVVITLRSGAAGSVTDGATTCTITGSAAANQACSDTSNTVTTTAGQVLTGKAVTPAALTANAMVNCTVQQTA